MVKMQRIRSPSWKVKATLAQLPEEEQARANQLLADWVEVEGVKPYEERDPCLLAVAAPKHRCLPAGRGKDCVAMESFPVIDHPEWWRDGAGRFIFTAHPYVLHGLADLFRWADAAGVSVEVYHPRRSWYYPDHTQLIVLKGRKEEGDDHISG
jgi:hypothetical protein